MKRIRLSLLLLLFFLFGTAGSTYAQFTQNHIEWAEKKKKKKKKKKKSNKKDDKEEEEDDYSFKEHLWYGVGLNLGFSSFNGVSAFGFGVAPMVGYKITPRFSVGPRLSLFYTSQKVTGFKAFNLLDTEAGVFVRGHVYRGFFVQGEVGYQRNQYLAQTLERVSEYRGTQYIGLGYNFSRGEGGPGSEISLMYNFAIARDVNTSQTPIDYRLAFTWGF